MYAPTGFRGLGDATCPSAEQLAGITDPSDPCQGLTVPVGTSVVSSSVLGGSGTGCPSGSTCTYIAGVPDNAVYVLAAIIAGFIIFGVATK
jgi:hypothetical protein